MKLKYVHVTFLVHIESLKYCTGLHCAAEKLNSVLESSCEFCTEELMSLGFHPCLLGSCLVFFQWHNSSVLILFSKLAWSCLKQVPLNNFHRVCNCCCIGGGAVLKGSLWMCIQDQFRSYQHV